MDEQPIICEDVQPVDLRKLASAVINQAVRDLTATSDGKGKPQTFQKHLAAFFWLTGPEFEIWSDFAGAEINVYKLLPNLSAAKKKLKGR